MNSTEGFSGTPEQDDTRVLKLSVVMNHAKKDFKFAFEGEWRGRDVKYVAGHVFREYRVHARNIRSEEAKKRQRAEKAESAVKPKRKYTRRKKKEE